MPSCAEIGCLSKHHYGTAAEEPVFAGSAQFAPFGTKAAYAPDTALVVSHIEAHLDFDFGSHSLDARVVLTVSNTLDTEVRTPRLTLNAVDFADVRIETALGGQKAHQESSSSYENSERIELAWTAAFAPKEARTVQVSYRIASPVAGLYWRRQKNGAEYVCTDHETERCRYWLPCIDFPTVRQTLHFFITVAGPAADKYTALANGSLVAHKGAAWEWKLDHICPAYLICLAIGEFEEVSDGKIGDCELKYYAPRGTPHRDITAAFDKTKGMIEWAQEKVGVKLPWSKYYQVCIYPTGGAMENISLVTFSDLFLMDKVLEKERKYLADQVNLHELAHSWFGNQLVVRYFEHAWLKESWATYMEACWLEDNLSKDDFTYEMFDSKVNYVNETNVYVRPIVTRNFSSSWTMFDRHLYPGGAWRLHMLRCKLGDNVFWSAVRAYVQRYSLKEAVETCDFKRFLEQHSGLNLTQFFDEWIYGKGFPKLKGEYAFDAATGKLALELEQTQVAADYSETKRGAEYGAPNSNGLFHFELEVEVVDSAGATHAAAFAFTRDAKAHATVQLPQGVTPKMVQYDPKNKVLFTLPLKFLSTEILAETAQHGTDMFSRIHSYEALAEKGTRDAYNKILAAVENEKFWGVRQRLGDAIAKSPTRQAIDVLARLIEREPEPMVHFPLFRNARLHADDALRSVILERLAPARVGELAYRGKGALYEALGFQGREAEDLPLLTRALEDDTLAGQHGLTRSGIVRGIAGFRSEAAWAVLAAWATVPQLTRAGDYVTPVIIEALGSLCEHLPAHYARKTVALLAPLLAQPMHPAGLLTDPILRALAATLAGLRYGRVAAIQPLMARQDWPWLHKQVRHSRAAGDEPATAAKLWESIEQWEAKYRELEARVGTVEKKGSE